MEEIAKHEGNFEQYSFLSYLGIEKMLSKTKNLAPKAQKKTSHPLVFLMADAQEEVVASLASSPFCLVSNLSIKRPVGTLINCILLPALTISVLRSLVHHQTWRLTG